MGAEGKIRLPDVDEVLDIGHAMHGANDPEIRGTFDQKLCRKIADDFLALEATPGTVEVPYLAAVRGVARSYGRALTRRKIEYLAKLEKAKEDRDYKQTQLRGSRINNQVLRVLWPFLSPLILGLTGFLTARVLGNVVPDDVADATGTSIPSIILTLVFIFAGRTLGTWYSERQRSKIVREFTTRCNDAFMDYELGKIREFELWRQRLIEEWVQYTGEPYGDRVSYQIIMKGDLRAARKMEEDHRVYNTHDVVLLYRFLRKLIVSIPRVVRPKKSIKKS
jgi:hypothetical protein